MLHAFENTRLNGSEKNNEDVMVVSGRLQIYIQKEERGKTIVIFHDDILGRKKHYIKNNPHIDIDSDSLNDYGIDAYQYSLDKDKINELNKAFDESDYINYVALVMRMINEDTFFNNRTLSNLTKIKEEENEEDSIYSYPACLNNMTKQVAEQSIKDNEQALESIKQSKNSFVYSHCVSFPSQQEIEERNKLSHHRP